MSTQAHWIPVPAKTEFKIAMLTYKILSTHQPADFTTLCFHTSLLKLRTFTTSNFFKSHH